MSNNRWKASLDDVALLIESAGGSITIPHRLLMDGRERIVERVEDFDTGAVRFTVRYADIPTTPGVAR